MASNESVATDGEGEGAVYLNELFKLSNAVCMIVNDFSGGGTGFIGFDGNNVLLVTVYHVINSLDTAIRSTFYFQYLAESQQPVVVNGTDLFAGCTVSDYNLCPDKVDGLYDLDYFIAKVNTNVLIDNPGQLNYTSIEISATVGVVDGDQVMVIQYPGRNRQCISHSTVVGSIDSVLVYKCQTLKGSSGSPVIKEVNNEYKLVAVHTGVFVDNEEGYGSAYCGSLISSIIKHTNGRDMKYMPTIQDYLMFKEIKLKRLQGPAVFANCTVADAFVVLTSRMMFLLRTADIYTLRRVCFEQQEANGIRLSPKTKQKVLSCNTIKDLFEVLAQTPYWEWCEIRLLSAMAHASGIQDSVRLLCDYKQSVFSRKVIEVLPGAPFEREWTEYYCNLYVKFKANFSVVTVHDVLTFHNEFEEVIFELAMRDGIKCALNYIKEGCIEIHSLIPTDFVDNAYTAAMQRRDKFKDIGLLYLQIGDKLVNCPQDTTTISPFSTENTLGCLVNDKTYKELSMIPSNSSDPCEVCHCCIGEVVCSRIFQACPQVKCNHDQIVVEEGKCCPKCADENKVNLEQGSKPNVETVLKRFMPQLEATLPINDNSFKDQLFQFGLTYGVLKDKLDNQFTTPAQKVKDLINDAILPNVACDNTNFLTLLKLMEHYGDGDGDVKNLAADIKSAAQLHNQTC